MCKDKNIGKFEFVTKTYFLYSNVGKTSVCPQLIFLKLLKHERSYSSAMLQNKNISKLLMCNLRRNIYNSKIQVLFYLFCVVKIVRKKVLDGHN